MKSVWQRAHSACANGSASYNVSNAPHGIIREILEGFGPPVPTFRGLCITNVITTTEPGWCCYIPTLAMIHTCEYSIEMRDHNSCPTRAGKSSSGDNNNDDKLSATPSKEPLVSRVTLLRRAPEDSVACAKTRTAAPVLNPDSDDVSTDARFSVTFKLFPAVERNRQFAFYDALLREARADTTIGAVARLVLCNMDNEIKGLDAWLSVAKWLTWLPCDREDTERKRDANLLLALWNVEAQHALLLRARFNTVVERVSLDQNAIDAVAHAAVAVTLSAARLNAISETMRACPVWSLDAARSPHAALSVLTAPLMERINELPVATGDRSVLSEMSRDPESALMTLFERLREILGWNPHFVLVQNTEPSSFVERFEALWSAAVDAAAREVAKRDELVLSIGGMPLRTHLKSHIEALPKIKQVECRLMDLGRFLSDATLLARSNTELSVLVDLPWQRRERRVPFSHFWARKDKQ